MAANQPVRPVRLPRSTLAEQAFPRARQPARKWFRAHPRGNRAISFSLKPTHRYSHPECPCSILYLAIDAESCLWEVFGDTVFDRGRALPKTLWDVMVISVVDVPSLRVCDLSRSSTRSALGVDLSALMSADLAVPQQWCLAIQKHPSNFAAIKFKSRFTGSACLAIFDRGEIRRGLRETLPAPLNSFDSALDWLTRNEVTLV